MIIMGIDPGLAILGYGLVKYEGNKFTVIDYGALITSSEMETSQRLAYLYKGLMEIIEKHKPDVCAIEELFFNKNLKTAMAVSQARGVAIVAAANAGVAIYEYTPLQVKQAVVGYGRADKNQIQQLVKLFLNLKEVPKPDDVADALAVALCHGHSSKFAHLFKV